MVRDADRGSPDDGRGAGRQAGQPDRALGRRKAESIDKLGLLVGSQEEIDRREATIIK